MRLSIITINRNNAIGLGKTMHNVYSQTFREFEYIIIDGSSTDNSLECIKKFASLLTHQLSYISEADTGIFNAMNKGIKLSQGEYLIFMNSGDTFTSINTLEQVMSYPFSEDYIFGDYNLVKNGEVILKDGKFPKEEPTLYSLYHHSLPHQSSLIKKSLFERFGYYDESLFLCGDRGQTIRDIIFNNCSVRHIPVTIANFDIESSDIKTASGVPERQVMFSKNIPARILMDFEYFDSFKTDLTILQWYKNHKILYVVFILTYKVFKKLFRMKFRNAKN